MSRGYNYHDQDGGYPDRRQHGRQDYSMSRQPRNDGPRGHDNRGYYPDDDYRESRRSNGRVEEFDGIDERSNGKKGKKKGKPEYDPSRKGPIKNRSCTDIICCILFLVFVGGLAVVAYFAYILGDPGALIYPQNSDGETCGFGNQRGKNYLFFFDLFQCAKVGPGVVVNGCPTPQVCVSKCPSENYVFLTSLAGGDKNKMICKDGVDKSAKPVHELIIDNDCAPYYLASEAVVGRCLPLKNLINITKSVLEVKDGDGNWQNVSSGTAGSFINATEFLKAREVFELFVEAKELGEKVIADVQTSWWMILVALGLACIISLIWIVLMRWIAGVMVWVSVVAFVLLFAGGSAFSFYMYYITKEEEPGAEYTFHIIVMQLSFQKEKFFLGIGIVAGIIFLIVFLIFLFLIQRIRIAIALIEEGSRAVGNMLFTLMWPIFPFVFQVVIVALWGTIAVYLASVGRAQNTPHNVTFANGTVDQSVVSSIAGQFCDFADYVQANSSLGSFCTDARYSGDNYSIYLQIYNVFMFFWLMNFVIALGQMTLAGAFASYYWAFNKKKDIPTFPLLFSFGRCIRYHLGTLAFGSLIIAIVQLIRLFLEYIDAKLKGTENPVAKFFIKCLKCCFWCLEKFLRFLNKNAYIMTAVYGKNFCSAARKAFMLILENCVRVVVVDKVTDFILLIAKLVVVGATGFVSYFFFDGRIQFLSDYTPKLNFYLVPIIIIIIVTYVIANAFFSVYDMAVDTLFICFLMDLDKNDGSEEKPYFMSKNLKKILGKKNKAPKEEEEPTQRGKKSRK